MSLLAVSRERCHITSSLRDSSAPFGEVSSVVRVPCRAAEKISGRATFNMDPELAKKALTQLGKLVVPCGSVEARLDSLTALQQEELLKSHVRNQLVKVGKKYVKTLKAAQEMVDAADVLALLPRDNATVPRTAQQPNLAIVPYVQTERVVADPPRPHRQAGHPLWDGFERYVADYMAHPHVRMIMMLGRLGGYVLWYVPLLLFTLCFIYFVAIVFHVLSNPEELVVMLFASVDAVPAYTQWAGKKMLIQVASEVRSRIR
jgi:hypothetical protein